MIDVDRRIGPWRARVWLLVLNFLANVLALVGLTRVMRGGAPWLLILGVVVTVVCIGLLAVPSHGPDD